MVVLGVLLVSWLGFRIAGAVGVRAFRKWRDSGRFALAVMLLFTGASHFGGLRFDLAAMVPDWVPNPLMVIYITGVLEWLGTIGILVPKTRQLAGVCLCLLFVVMFPANLKAAQDGLTIGGNPATALWLRLPMQILFIWLAWWSTRRAALVGPQ